MVLFKKFRETNAYVVYTSTEVHIVGKWTEIYIKKSSDMSDYNELELNPVKK